MFLNEKIEIKCIYKSLRYQSNDKKTKDKVYEDKKKRLEIFIIHHLDDIGHAVNRHHNHQLHYLADVDVGSHLLGGTREYFI